MSRTEMARKNRRTGRFLLAIAIAFGLAGFYVAWRPQSPQTLLLKASRVPGASQILPTWVIWVSDHEYITLLITPFSKRTNTLPLQRIDAETGNQTALPTLDKLAAKAVQGSINRYPQILPAPDGRHVLLHCLDDPTYNRLLSGTVIAVGAKPSAEIALSDGTGSKSIPLSGSLGQIAWMPDGRGWIELVGAPKGTRETLILHRPDGTIHSLTMPTFVLPPMALRASLLGVTDQGHLLFSTCGQPRILGNGIAFYEISLSPTGATVRKYVVPDLPDGTFESVILSPKGDRLAWQQYEDKASMFSMFGRSPRTSRIWTSRLDGSKMHEVGHVQTDLYTQGLSGLQWLPNGKRLSFYFEEGLYTVPAE